MVAVLEGVAIRCHEQTERETGEKVQACSFACADGNRDQTFSARIPAGRAAPKLGEPVQARGELVHGKSGTWFMRAVLVN